MKRKKKDIPVSHMSVGEILDLEHRHSATLGSATGFIKPKPLAQRPLCPYARTLKD